MTNELNRILNDFGMILLNNNADLPSVMGLGYDWQAILALIEKGEAFHCKLYKNKTTYISREIYYCLKKIRKNENTNNCESIILAAIKNSTGGVSTKILRSATAINKTEFKKGMASLSKKMLITVIGSGDYINDNWSELLWGTARVWEEKKGEMFFSNNDASMIARQKLSIFLPPVEVGKILS